jgi:hypothetical protein
VADTTTKQLFAGSSVSATACLSVCVVTKDRDFLCSGHKKRGSKKYNLATTLYVSRPTRHTHTQTHREMDTSLEEPSVMHFLYSDMGHILLPREIRSVYIRNMWLYMIFCCLTKMLLASHLGCPCSVPDQVMWDL